MSPLDLHVLGTPPAFVLSQDQTLPFNPSHLSMFNSLESSLSIPCAVRENRDYDSAVRVRFLFLARFFSLYRFQGSLRSFRGLSATSIFATAHRADRSFRLISPLMIYPPPEVITGSSAGELE